MALNQPRQPSVSAPPGMRWEVVSSTDVSLGGGQEWSSQPILLAANEIACLRCDAPVRFYAGIFEEGEYQAARRRSQLAFPFVRGTDQTTFERVVRISNAGSYRVVLRIGVFAPAGQISVGVWRAVDVPVPATVPITEDSSAEVHRSKRGRWAFAGIAAVVGAVGVWLLWYDFAVVGLTNRSLFFAALSSEAEAVLAVAAVIAGMYALWRELVFPRRK